MFPKGADTWGKVPYFVTKLLIDQFVPSYFVVIALNFYYPGIPVQEDELLFAVPVCAPYNTMANYKFKGMLYT